MNYQSTRGGGKKVSAARAILQGLAEDGGLFVPDQRDLIKLPLETMLSLDYHQMAAMILNAMLPGFDKERLLRFAHEAYDGKFASKKVTPLSKVGETYVLELYHGPTCAFKDVALCLLPLLMQEAKRMENMQEDVMILTATSGDTGKAALSGFQDVEGVRILVFFPEEGVSPIQKLQMVTQEGSNVGVCGILGNFDDAQSKVKEIFQAPPKGVFLTSANSINIGRLVPQMVYYLSAYRDLVQEGRIPMGGLMDFSVPTGNFGDILAGYLMKQMGLPIGRLICASNKNHILTDFFTTGIYDRRREFYQTSSPSMDILISSNLERLLYFVTQDPLFVLSCMEDLKEQGIFTVPEDIRRKIAADFAAGYADEEATKMTIRHVFETEHYLMDPHTAVAYRVGEDYQNSGMAEDRPLVVLSTASPYKFPQTCLQALFPGHGPEEAAAADPQEAMKKLREVSGMPIPESLLGLETKPLRHQDVIKPQEMAAYVQKWIQ